MQSTTAPTAIPTPVHRSARALTSLDDALAQILAHISPLPEQSCDLYEADGFVLARDYVSAINVPPLDNSAMDGYAVRRADLTGAGPWTLPVSQRIAAGQMGAPLAAGTAARIFTGAPIPAGADAVIMQEQCTIVAQDTPKSPNSSNSAQNPEQTNPPFEPRLEPRLESKFEAVHDAAPASPPLVRIEASAPTAGQWIRRAGQDIAAGSVALSRGTRLNPASLGLAASLGLRTLQVHRRVRVALFSTGDELVEPGSIAPASLPAGHIFNSNRAMLSAILRRWGCAVSDGGILPDDLAATKTALAQAAQAHDLIITSAGASVGEADHITTAIAALGTLQLHQIAMKPGKPLAWGNVPATATPDHSPTQAQTPSNQNPVLGRGCHPQQTAHFLGLPGNPAASLVGCLLVVRAVVLALQGAAQTQPRAVAVAADFDWPRADARREFLRARINAAGRLELFANQNSGVLSSAVWADGLVDCPPNTPIRAGDVVRFLPFSQLWES